MLESSSPLRPRTRHWLLILLSAALVIHILSASGIYLFRPQSISTTPDPLDYRLAALNMIQYHIFSLEPASFHAPQLLRTPIYPAIVAAGYLIDGESGYAVIVLQSVLLIIMGWLLFKLLMRFGVTENVSLALTAFSLFEPLQWLYSLQTMTETVASFLVILLLAGALLGKGISDFWRAALFGVGLGLLYLEKPSASMWIPFLLVLVFLRVTDPWRTRFLRVGIALLFMLLTLSPWVLRNYELTGHAIVSSSGPYNLIYFLGTPATVPDAYYEPLTVNTYNGNHTNDTWYAYTVQAYPMLLSTEHTLLAHENYASFIGQQIACVPSVWFGNIKLQDQESYGHEYPLIADFVLHPNAKRDALIAVLDTFIWSIMLLLFVLGSLVLLSKKKTRWAYLPLLGMLLATLFINFCASWVRVLLPMYPVIFIAAGVGLTALLQLRDPQVRARIRSTPSLLRRAEYETLSTIELSGSVVDLGGEMRAGYAEQFKGDFSVTTVNMDTETVPDVFHDLEQPLPFPDASFDHALLINVLEHIYEHRQLLEETVRIVKPSGSVIIAVPFLFPIHPSPKDFWRYSRQTLEAECKNIGLIVEKIVPLGTGVFSVRYVLLDRLLPAPIRFLSHYSLRYVTLLLDRLFTATAHALHKRYDPAEYALGYIVHARKV